MQLSAIFRIFGRKFVTEPDAKIGDNFQPTKYFGNYFQLMGTILSRIQEISSKEGITIGAMERSIGASKGVLSRAIANGTDIQSKWIQKIADNYPDYSSEWLLTGKGGMIKSNIITLGDVVGSTQNTGNNNTTTTNNYNNYKGCGGADKKAAQDIIDIASRVSVIEEEIPITTANAIGCPYYDVDFVAGFDEVINSQVTIPTRNILVPGFEKATLWCNVTGHSMKPRINHDDKIALRECTVADIVFGKIYAVVLDTKRTVKILRRAKDPKKLRYVPINTEEYDEEDIASSKIIKIYEVLGNISRFF